MTKKEIIDNVSKKIGIPSRITRVVFEAAIEEIKDSVANNNSVYIRGFGAITRNLRKSKIGQDLGKGGGSIVIPEQYKPHFKSYKDFIDICNKRN